MYANLVTLCLVLCVTPMKPQAMPEISLLMLEITITLCIKSIYHLHLRSGIFTFLLKCNRGE